MSSFSEMVCSQPLPRQEKKDASAMLKILEVFQILGKVGFGRVASLGLYSICLSFTVSLLLSLPLSHLLC